MANNNTNIVVKEFGSTEKDTGSTPVQIALLSKKISHLTQHCKKFPKDSSSKRGLTEMVAQRKKLCAYLKKKVKPEEYTSMVDRLIPKKVK